MRSGSVVFLVCLALAGCRDSQPASGPLMGDQALLVAAASDLRPAFEELGEVFTETTDHEVVFDFGSSGQLAQRIIEGAPVDVYASANLDFVDRVLASGRGDPSTKTTYAYGRIVIWARTDLWHGWTDLDALGSDQGVRFVAIANPQHAPYGLAAKEALLESGNWDTLEARLVFGENISDTQRLAENGDADVAIVALSLAMAAGERGSWELIDDGLHNPLEQALVVTVEDPARVGAAVEFVELVGSPRGREVMNRYGFVLPGEVGG